MNELDLIGFRSATPYHCSSCSRCFVALGAVPAGELLCQCGAPLSARSLPHGVYELGSAIPDEARSKAPDRAQIPVEADNGYGASHGYDATHGGPSGPGDAPAKVTGAAR